MTVGKIIEMMGIFHEGVIVELNYTDYDLNFKLHCKSLANLIQDDYKYFYGVFKSCSDTYFEPVTIESIKIVDILQINQLNIELLQIERASNEYIQIFVNCGNTYTGGNWFVKCEDLKIYDEDFRELGLIELVELSEKFWFLTKN